MWSLCIRPAVTELHNTEQLERVRKEKNVCFFLVTSNENSQLSEKIKVIFESIVGLVCWKRIVIIRFDYKYNIEYWYIYDSGIWGKWYSLNYGRFPFNKNSSLNFRKLHVLNVTVHSGCTDPTQATTRFVIVASQHTHNYTLKEKSKYCLYPKEHSTVKKGRWKSKGRGILFRVQSL